MSSSARYISLPPYAGGGDGKSGGFVRLQSRTQALFTTRRPWRELLAHPSSYSVPHGLGEFTERVRGNLAHFRVNYSIIVLLILFLSLLYHPISIIVFLIVSVFWFLLYFFRDEPVVVFNRIVDDRVVLVVLGIVTIVSLLLTKVWRNVLVSLSIGAVAVVLHATFRLTEDLFLDEDEIVDGGMPSVAGTRF